MLTGLQLQCNIKQRGRSYPVVPLSGKTIFMAKGSRKNIRTFAEADDQSSKGAEASQKDADEFNKEFQKRMGSILNGKDPEPMPDVEVEDEEAEYVPEFQHQVLTLLKDAQDNVSDAAVQNMLQGVESEILNVLGENDSLRNIIADQELNQQNNKQKLATLADQYKRLSADFDNFRKRTASEQEAIKARVKESVIKDLLVLIDNFELAVQQVKPTSPEEEKINNSYQGLYKQLVGVFQSMGVVAVPVLGEQFDPNTMEALAKFPRDDAVDQSVVEEYRKGFQMNGKLIRPAQVVVAENPDMPAPPPPPKEDTSEQSSEEGSSD